MNNKITKIVELIELLLTNHCDLIETYDSLIIRKFCKETTFISDYTYSGCYILDIDSQNYRIKIIFDYSDIITKLFIKRSEITIVFNEMISTVLMIIKICKTNIIKIYLNEIHDDYNINSEETNFIFQINNKNIKNIKNIKIPNLEIITGN